MEVADRGVTSGETSKVLANYNFEDMLIFNTLHFVNGYELRNEGTGNK